MECRIEGVQGLGRLETKVSDGRLAVRNASEHIRLAGVELRSVVAWKRGIYCEEAFRTLTQINSPSLYGSLRTVNRHIVRLLLSIQ